MKRNILELEMLLKLPIVDEEYGFDLSPDGTQIAFSSNRTGQWHIYTMPLDRSAAPRQITSGPGANFAPRWPRDGL
jgi:Tol biopolymer transport system component